MAIQVSLQDVTDDINTTRGSSKGTDTASQKRTQDRESRIIKNINHHISKKLVEIAVSEKCGIRFEKLKGIGKNKKHSKNFRYSLNPWSYYAIQQYIQYLFLRSNLEGPSTLFGLI